MDMITFEGMGFFSRKNTANKKKARIALMLILCGVLLLGISASCPWMHVIIGDGLGKPLIENISGKQWSAALMPLCLVIALGAGMQVFIRGKMAYIGSYIIAILGFITAISPLTVLGGSEGDFLNYLVSRQLISDRYIIELVRAQWATVFIALVGSFFIIGGAIYSLRYPLAGDNSRYETSGARERKLHEEILTRYEHDTQDDSDDEKKDEISDEKIGKKSTEISQQNLWKAQDYGIDLTDSD